MPTYRYKKVKQPMINPELIQHYKLAIASIDDLEIKNEREEDNGKSYMFIINHDNANFLIKIQSESDEDSETKHIFSINLVMRITNISKNKKDAQLLSIVNKFNEQYAIVKCILHKNKNENTFWFRSETITNELLSRDLVSNIMSVIKTSPKLLSAISKAK